MEVPQKIVEKVKESGITDEQRSMIYSYATKVSKETINEVCPALLRVLLNDETGALKGSLGQVIFHLQKNERIDSLIGLQKMTEAALKVAPEEAFKILESSEDDAKELARRIKEIL
ncbi:MAG: hypothetical protein ACTSPS_03935 [Promethearchaeota archaeon]